MKSLSEFINICEKGYMDSLNMTDICMKDCRFKEANQFIQRSIVYKALLVQMDYSNEDLLRLEKAATHQK